MNSSLLAQPSEVYRPFTRAESDVLRGFVEDVRRLAGMRFFSQVPSAASISWEAGQPVRAEMEEPDDEAVRAAVTLFRQLYNQKEPGSFSAVFKLLKRSAHERGGQRRDETIAALDGHVTAAREAVRAGIGMGIVFDHGDKQKPIGPRDIIDAYFHGHYLHARNDKSELARRLDGLQPWPKYTLYTVMLALRNVYWVAANVVDRVLAEPALLDADVGGPGREMRLEATRVRADTS